MSVTLDLEPNVNVLAGYEFGKEIYNTQVKGRLDFRYENMIVIPEEIKDISIAFIKGFTEDIFTHIKTSEFYNIIIIKANLKVKTKFRLAVYVWL